jgi:hypothetical protein
MRSLFLLLFATLLIGCQQSQAPISLIVPSDPHILHGVWRGTVTPRNHPEGPVESVELSSRATYLSSNVYAIEGSMTFRNRVYALSGKGEGLWGATFRAQDVERGPSLFWDVTLSENGRNVGDIIAANNPYGSTVQVLAFRLYPQATGSPSMDSYDAELNRVQ